MFQMHPGLMSKIFKILFYILICVLILLLIAAILVNTIDFSIFEEDFSDIYNP